MAKLLTVTKPNKLFKIIKVCKSPVEGLKTGTESELVNMADLIKKNYYGTFEVARLCQVSPASVSRWIKSGKVNASQTVGGHKRVSRDGLVKLLRELNLSVPPELEQGTGIKALIIDDEPIIRKLLRISLADHFDDLAIEEAEDGFQAGMKLMSHLPDLVTLDLGLPGIDGYEICRIVKASPELAHTKLLVITGQTGKEPRERILKAGADAFLEKPVQKAALRETILELFEAGAK